MSGKAHGYDPVTSPEYVLEGVSRKHPQGIGGVYTRIQRYFEIPFARGAVPDMIGNYLFPRAGFQSIPPLIDNGSIEKNARDEEHKILLGGRHDGVAAVRLGFGDLINPMPGKSRRG